MASVVAQVRVDVGREGGREGGERRKENGGVYISLSQVDENLKLTSSSLPSSLHPSLPPSHPTGYFYPPHDSSSLLSPPSSYRPTVKGGREGGREGGLRSPNTSLLSMATTVSAASSSHHSVSRYSRLS